MKYNIIKTTYKFVKMDEIRKMSREERIKIAKAIWAKRT